MFLPSLQDKKIVKVRTVADVFGLKNPALAGQQQLALLGYRRTWGCLVVNIYLH